MGRIERSTLLVSISMRPSSTKREADTVGLGVADWLGNLDLLADQREFLTKPGFEIGEQRSGSHLADSAPLFSAAAADVLLDGVEDRDPFEHLARDRRGGVDGEFIISSGACLQLEASWSCPLSARVRGR
jgi:hypothetical protein